MLEPFLILLLILLLILPAGRVYSMLEPFLIANGYGLFRDMTGVGPSVLDTHGRVVAQVLTYADVC